MASDLAAVAPSLIVCVAFLIGVGLVLRREMAPKRRAGVKGDDSTDDQRPGERDEASES